MHAPNIGTYFLEKAIENLPYILARASGNLAVGLDSGSRFKPGTSFAGMTLLYLG
jgi:hypothetical protein